MTVKDVALAARESYLSIEHVKRYTTLSMATDQGKTSSVNGAATLALASGRDIAALGTTTYRPPFTPVPMPALAGMRRGELLNPVRRLPLEARHRAHGAVFDDYGGWLRPAFYGEASGKAAAIEREARTARDAVAIFDGSPLGKIEVIGPDAAAFLDFNSYMTMSTLQPGRLRYFLLLQENGVVFDDGVIARLSPERFVVSCSTSHVAARPRAAGRLAAGSIRPVARLRPQRHRALDDADRLRAAVAQAGRTARTRNRPRRIRRCRIWRWPKGVSPAMRRASRASASPAIAHTKSPCARRGPRRCSTDCSKSDAISPSGCSASRR